VPKSRPYILIAEADEIVADITSFRLELLGNEVNVAQRGEQVSSLAKDRRPDLFIIDLRLPGLSGLALIEQLTASETTSTIPILAISFDAEVDQVEQAFTAGATDYLVAPFDPLILAEKVAVLLGDLPVEHSRSNLVKA